MSNNPLRLMVDTNVWADLFIPGRPLRESSLEFFTESALSATELLYTTDIARAVFRLVSYEAKAWIRTGKGTLSDEDAHAVNHHAWDVIERMQDLGTAIGSDHTDLWLATKYQDLHPEIEDNLIIAASRRAEADYLVTNDLKLIKHAPVATLTPADMTKVLST